MRSKTIILAGALAVLAVSALAAAPARAAPNPPIQNTQNTDIGTVLQGTQSVLGTYYGTPAINNNQWGGVTCVNLWSSSSGSVNETWSIEGYDAATNSHYEIKAATAISFSEAAGLQHTLTVHPGVATSSLPTRYEAQSAVLPKVWRIKSVVAAGAGGSNSVVSRKIGCNYIK